MPNHVINELSFEGDVLYLNRIELMTTRKGIIDFSILLPPPLNSWPGSVGEKHKVFPTNHLDWCSKNWSTKWNAYGHDEGYKSLLFVPGTLTLTFKTAWSPPYGWMLAVFNHFEASFRYGWLSEGQERAMRGAFNFAALQGWPTLDAWVECPATDDEHRHLHKLLWGVESFDEERT